MLRQLANIYSVEFVVETADERNGMHYRQVFRNNMQEKVGMPRRLDRQLLADLFVHPFNCFGCCGCPRDAHSETASRSEN